MLGDLLDLQLQVIGDVFDLQALGTEIGASGLQHDDMVVPFGVGVRDTEAVQTV